MKGVSWGEGGEGMRGSEGADRHGENRDELRGCDGGVWGGEGVGDLPTSV